MLRLDLRAARAKRFFGADEKLIRTKKRLWIEAKAVSGWFYFKIANCVRTCFSSARNRRSARTGRRPRKSWRYFFLFTERFFLADLLLFTRVV